MNAIERLESMLDAKDAEIEALQRKLDVAERQIESDASWCRHREYEQDVAPSPELPVPRLEIRWSEHPVEGTEAVYSLVYRHLCGQVVFVPLGRTRTSGAINDRIGYGQPIPTPFRDGSHFANEMRQLGLRGFVIAGDRVHESKLCEQCGRLDEVHHGSAKIGKTCTMPKRELCG